MKKINPLYLIIGAIAIIIILKAAGMFAVVTEIRSTQSACESAASSLESQHFDCTTCVLKSSGWFTYCDCASGYVYSGGYCVPTSTYTCEYTKKCRLGDVYWYDNNGNPCKLYQSCDEACENAKCVAFPTEPTTPTTPTTTEGCSDSDGGPKADIFGKCTETFDGYTFVSEDTCSGTTTVKEVYCSGSQCASTYLTCQSGYKCEGGKCIVDTTPPPTTPAPAGICCIPILGGLPVYSSDASSCPAGTKESGLCCSDSDGGKNYYVKGTIKMGTVAKAIDACLVDGRLREWYCSGYSYTKEEVSCPTDNVCSYGLCVKGTTGCTDSDGGIKQNIFGKVTIGTTVKEDYCISTTAVNEYFCDSASSTGYKYSGIVCATNYKCKSGECIYSPTTTTTTDCTPGYSGDYFCDGDKIYQHYVYTNCTTIDVFSGSCGTGYECIDGKCSVTTIDEATGETIIEETLSGEDISDPICILDERKCSDDFNYYVCLDQYSWSGEQACPANIPLCVNGECATEEQVEEESLDTGEASNVDKDLISEVLPTPDYVPRELKKLLWGISYFWWLMGVIAMIMGYLIFTRKPRKKKRR